MNLVQALNHTVLLTSVSRVPAERHKSYHGKLNLEFEVSFPIFTKFGFVESIITY